MEYNCDLIKDLLPLYVENLCSDYTKKVVEEHIASCSGCEYVLNSLRLQANPMSTENDKQENSDSINPFLKIKEKTRQKIAIIVICMMCLGLLFNHTFVQYYIRGNPVPLSNLEILSFSRLSDTSFELEVTTTDPAKLILYYAHWAEEDKNIINLQYHYVGRASFNRDLFSQVSRDIIDLSEYALNGEKIKAIYIVGEDIENEKQLVWKE